MPSAPPKYGRNIGLFLQQYLLQQLLRRGGANETGYVDVDKSRHEELAVEAVHYAPMAWDDVTKVL